MDCLGSLCYICVFCLMLNNMQIVFGVYKAGNDHGFRFHKVESMLGERATHGQPTTQIGTVKNSPDLLVGPKMSMCYLHEFS